MSTPEQRRPRRDVVRNRQALVDAARDAFATTGLHAPLEQIAAAAGLGNATLYRHFPTRAALWEAVLVEPLDEVLALVDRCATLATADAWTGFATFVRESAEIEARRTGFTELMTTDYRDAPTLLSRRIAIQTRLADLFDEAQAVGAIRADAALADVALAQLSIANTIGTFGAVAPEVHRRWVDLVLDALRAPGAQREPLRGRPLRGDQVRRATAHATHPGHTARDASRTHGTRRIPDTRTDARCHTRDMADDEHFFVVDGRRWRRTDPALPEELAATLRSHLGRARSAIGHAGRAGDDDAVAAARHRVGIAKRGLGERGPEWWTRDEADRIADARAAVRELDPALDRDLDPEPDPEADA